MPRFPVPLLFRKVRLRHAEEAVELEHEQAHVVAEPHKFRRISRLIAGFSWF
jgi:hypothetical protein